MLQTQTVEAGTLDLIQRLMNDAELSAFNLVGGTALSLMIGHRKSIDIDLFTDRDFDSKALSAYLSDRYSISEIRTIKNGIFCFIDNVKVDLISHKYPIIGPLNIQQGIRIVSLEDIGAMKLNAIVNSGNRLKDFIDMYFLLEHVPFLLLRKSFEEKYPEFNRHIAQNALLFHDDINFKVKVEVLGKDVSIDEMAQRFRMAIQNPARVFKQNVEHPLLKVSEDKIRKNPKRGQGL
ncbi:MAG: nucleotidyl transferase AbiEii/AbiGii toxin family protein [Chitinophagaceae bacterium]|nr:nucleotidyl transferase AbiEii/AbiGii toxin family protein [Chitinophagaceae bacterium]MCA6455255.1 nucleotidyl transferase AbiEii/AbiGii toxin family protein [Chitinophagaceae bacterium]MCA6460055.1 nucleotidyl transferase AbiEii/AbiGii toxin family protein [Chitinophagaceae bacterium]MCA6465408.1 nucleotidyl transferase AbiEii/AbiGii toxin family protein [Chitinophagaceae bacterium]